MTAIIGVITFGTNFTGSIEVGYPLENARKWSENRGGKKSTFQAQSGIEVGWVRGTDHILEGTVRWVPKASGSTTSFGEPLSGRDGAEGWDAFIESTREAKQFRWHGDKVNASGSFILSTAVEFGNPTLESADGTYNFSMRIRNPNEPYIGY